MFINEFVITRLLAVNLLHYKSTWSVLSTLFSVLLSMRSSLQLRSFELLNKCFQYLIKALALIMSSWKGEQYLFLVIVLVIAGINCDFCDDKKTGRMKDFDGSRRNVINTTLISSSINYFDVEDISQSTLNVIRDSKSLPDS